MRLLVLICLATAVPSVSTSAYANDDRIFASYVDGSSGSVNGVNFTLPALSTPALGTDIRLKDLEPCAHTA
jgi:hypothetical protein